MNAVAQEAVQLAARLKTNLESCILGKSGEIELLLTALLSGGHVLLEDVPGTGKTVLVKALAKSVEGHFRRIQCNPDLLPTDITGVSIYHPKQESFVFRPGPVMTNLLLVDEINRATTKTQSALLEAMEEQSISADGESYPLPAPFLLIATQNPIDFEGTYPLPEAQLDRFLMKLKLGYPDHETEKQMLRDQAERHPLDRLEPVMDIQGLLSLQEEVKQVHIDDAVMDYLVSIVQETRRHRSLLLGASPRATLALLSAGKALALLRGRDYVIPDDLKYLTPYVLGHRLLLHTDARLDGQSAEGVLEQLLQGVRVPIRLEK